MLALLIMGCGTPDDSYEDRPEPSEVSNTECRENDEYVRIESGWTDEGYSFAWEMDPQWLADGGDFEDEDASAIVAECPACEFQGVTRYGVTVTVTDDATGEWVWQFVTVDQLCGVK